MTVSILLAAAAAAAQAAAPQSSTAFQAQPLQPAPAVAVQPTIAPAAPQAVILSAPTQSVLRAGVEVPLRMEEALDSNNKSLREGQQVRLSVASDVRLGNVVVIPAGRLALNPTDVHRSKRSAKTLVPGSYGRVSPMV